MGTLESSWAGREGRPTVGVHRPQSISQLQLPEQIPQATWLRQQESIVSRLRSPEV